MKKKICIASRLIHALILTAGFAATAFGQTDFWEPVKGPLAGQVLALAVDRNEVIFAGTNVGVARSVDNGDSWEFDLPGRAVLALAINDAGHIFAGTIGRGVYRSTDQGETWSEVNNGLTMPLVLALIINSDQHLFAGTYFGGVFRSTDNGDSWEETNIGLNAPSIAALAINDAGHIFAAAPGINTGGVFRSLNNGDNWEAVNSGLPQANVFALGFDRQGRILAGTDGDGVFRSIRTTTSVDEDAGDLPLSFALAQNYPNPFNPSTTITFDLAKPSPVKLKVFDVTGREVAVLADQIFQAGTHRIVFTPNGLTDGLYFYRIEAGEFAQTNKLTLLK